MSLGPYTGFDCAVCAGPMHELGWLGATYHMRCRNCGADEFIDESEADAAASRRDDPDCHEDGCEACGGCPEHGGCDET